MHIILMIVPTELLKLRKNEIKYKWNILLKRFGKEDTSQSFEYLNEMQRNSTEFVQ